MVGLLEIMIVVGIVTKIVKRWLFIPSFEEGTMRRSSKWNVTLDTAQRGEVKHLLTWRVV
jgi:hypothetical protein